MPSGIEYYDLNNSLWGDINREAISSIILLLILRSRGIHCNLPFLLMVGSLGRGLHTKCCRRLYHFGPKNSFHLLAECGASKNFQAFAAMVYYEACQKIEGLLP